MSWKDRRRLMKIQGVPNFFLANEVWPVLQLSVCPPKKQSWVMNYHLLRTCFSDMAPVNAGNEGGLFQRASRDKRLVRQVLIHHQPHHWVPMDVTSNECKLMEVRKFSSEYHNIDVM